MTDPPVELESQVILRLPDVPATIVRDILRYNPSSLKDRLKIKLDSDARQGTLYLDNFVLQATLVDLPCIIESHKTIENKHIYKTADIAQMLVCTEDDQDQEKEGQKNKKEIRIDKKFMYPHGITPPMKNVRKRRFRRTLKKKQYSDQPELEKEVRRLLRTDYEAQQITWEVIDEEDQQNNAENGGTGTKDVLMQGSKTNEEPTTKTGRRSAVEHIFGEELSDSDMDDDDDMRMDDREESRLTIDSGDEESQSDDTSTRDSSAIRKKPSSSQHPTSFSGAMFSSKGSAESESPQKSGRQHKMTASDYRAMSTSQLKERLTVLKQQLTEISARSQIQEAELASIESIGLRQRLRTVLDKLLNDQADKEQEIGFVEKLLAGKLDE